MASVCSCDVGLGNTGTGRTPAMSVASGLIFVPKYDQDGNRNKITLSDTLNSTYFSNLLNQADKSKRFYPVQGLKNVTDERADSITEQADDGTSYHVQDGVATFTGMIFGGPQQLVEALKTLRCDEVCAYIVDKNCGNLIGTVGTDQDACDPAYLYPIEIDKGSVDPKFMKASGTTIQKVSLKFNWHIDEADENLRVITREEAGVDPRTLRGLYEVCSEISSITTTGFVAELRVLGYGTVLNPLLDEGLVAADFALFNITTNLSVTITSVTEDSDGGTYTFVIPSQSVGDELRLTPTKTGRDYALVVANTFEIPTT